METKSVLPVAIWNTIITWFVKTSRNRYFWTTSNKIHIRKFRSLPFPHTSCSIQKWFKQATQCIRIFSNSSSFSGFYKSSSAHSHTVTHSCFLCCMNDANIFVLIFFSVLLLPCCLSDIQRFCPPFFIVVSSTILLK